MSGVFLLKLSIAGIARMESPIQFGAGTTILTCSILFAYEELVKEPMA